MRLATLTALAMLLSAACASSGGAAPAFPKPYIDPSSSRPVAVFDEVKCEAVWSMALRQGDTLSADEAAPFIANFEMVDTSGDGKITQDELREGCKKGLVREHPYSGQ